MNLQRLFTTVAAATLISATLHATSTSTGTATTSSKPAAATHATTKTSTSASTAPAASTPASKASSSSTSAMAPARSDVPADLAKEAKVSLEAARKTALAHVKNGTVRSEELEREHGKLVYSFDIATPGKSGVSEVHVDAMTGKYLGTHHETAAKEKQEAKEESKPHAG
jgi:uncharacterized membrane protein YkoI